MPPFEDKDLESYAVFWNYLGKDREGELLLDNACEIPVRWVDKLALSITPQTTVIQYDAIVHVDESVNIVAQSVIWNGQYADLDLTSTSMQLYQVSKISYATDLKGRTGNKILGLMRYKGQLPPGTST